MVVTVGKVFLVSSVEARMLKVLPCIGWPHDKG